LIDKFLDIPYLKDGRSFSGVDCYGLCWLFGKYNNVNYPIVIGEDIYSVKNIEGLILQKKKLFRRIQNGMEKKYDLILFRVKGHLTHVGVVCSPDMFLHIFEGGSGLSECLSYKGNLWEKRIDSFWRYTD